MDTTEAFDQLYALQTESARAGKAEVADGVTLYYEVHESSPDAETVVFLNNNFIAAPLWRDFTDSIAKEYNLVFYDFRNQGASSNVDGKSSWDDYVSDLAGLLDHLGLDRVHVVASSIGTLLARDFYLAHGDRVRSLALVGPPFSPYGGKRRHYANAAWINSLRNGGLEDLWASLFSTCFHDQNVAAGGDAMYLGLREAFCMINRAERLQVSLPASDTSDDDPEKLKRLDVETLLLIGDADFFWNDSNRQDVLDLLPNAQLDIIHRTGHLPYFENAAAFQESILKFLRGLSMDR